MSNLESNANEVKLHALDYWQVIRNRYGIILLTFALVFLTATIVTSLLPKQYSGRSQLEIERKSTARDYYGEVTDRANTLDPYNTFMATEFQVIQSRETLNRVIEKLDLIKKWNVGGGAQAFGVLRSKIELEPGQNTNLVRIQVYDEDPHLAAAIANEVAIAYQERRSEQERQRSKAIVDNLVVQIRSQDAKLDAARVKMLDMAEDLKIPDLASGKPSWMRGEAETGKEKLVMLAMQQELSAETEIGTLRATINTLRDLEGDSLIKAAHSLGVNDATIQQLFPQYNNALVDRTNFVNAGLGAKHPKIVALDGTIDQLQEMLLEAAENAKRTLGVQLDMAEQKLASYNQTSEESVEELLSQKRSIIEYEEAKADYNLARQVRADLEEQYAKEKVNATTPQIPVRIHEKAEVSFGQAKPNVKLNLIIGAVVGLVMGIGLAFFLEYMDTSVKSLEDVERYLQVPVLAVIPKDVGVLHKQSGLSPDAEAYRILRTNIEFNRKSADANSITVVSGGAGEGKSTTLMNLAYICAQGGYNTLMIDGDLRRPRLHTFFDINNSVGLTNYLTTDLMLEDVILQTPVDNLYFMPSGILPADAAGILNSRRMSELIADVKSRFDLVLIDSPPILGVSDASVLASECDLTMIVIQHRKLPRNMLIRVRQAIENVGGTVLGVVLNNVDVRSDSQYQYYTSYYTYYSPTNTDNKSKSRVADIEPRETPEDIAPQEDYGASEPSEPAPATESQDYSQFEEDEY
ncbi:MAG: polysaccharide biosynthesis tyrosine autokinase [Verrucomicrobiota bacterium]